MVFLWGYDDIKANSAFIYVPNKTVLCSEICCHREYGDFREEQSVMKRKM